MIPGILAFVVANFAVLLAAREVLSKVRTGIPSTDLLLFLLVRLLLISALVILAGCAGFLTPWGLGGVGALVLLGILVARKKEAFRLPVIPAIGRVAWVFVGVLAVRYVLQTWVFAPHLGDVVAYHLPKVAEWVQAGAFTREMGLHPHVTFPAGFELIETWWVVFWRHDVLIEMAGAEFLLLGGIAVLSIARRVGLPHNASLMAAGAWMLLPGAYLSALSGLNDTPAAAVVLSTSALVLSRAPLWSILLAVGVGAGIKATTLYALPGWILLEVLIGSGRRRMTSHGIGWAAAGIAIAAGCFWYARNTAWYGNPVYPVGEPSYAEEPVAVQQGPQLASLWGNTSDLVEERIYDRQAPLGPNVDYSAGWGGLVFSCGLVGLAIALRTHSLLRRLSLSFGLSLFCVFLFSIHDPWSMKYVFFFPALLCIAAAQLWQSGGAVRGAFVAGLVFCFAGTMLSYDLQFSHAKVLFDQPWKGRTAAVFREAELKGDAIACFGGHNAFAYQLYGPAFERRVIYLRAHSSEELVSALRGSGVERIYASPVAPQQQRVLQVAVQRGFLKPMGGRVYLVIRK